MTSNKIPQEENWFKRKEENNGFVLFGYFFFLFLGLVLGVFIGRGIW